MKSFTLTSDRAKKLIEKIKSEAPEIGGTENRIKTIGTGGQKGYLMPTE